MPADSIVSVAAGSSRSINQPATVEAQLFLSFIGVRNWAMMKGHVRAVKAYHTCACFLTTDFTVFSGFRFPDLLIYAAYPQQSLL